MKAQPVLHPAPEQLSAFGLGKLHETAAAAIAQHLAGCETCRKALERVPGDTFVGMVRAAKAPASISPSSPTPAPKDKLTPPQPAAPPPELPSELAKHAKYRIRRELGRGGMGIVYQAEHITMERLVAIKVINKSVLDHPQALERFAQEVKAAAKLSHPNIVAAYDFEQAGALHMLVMEFVEGQNLAEIVERKGPLPILNACHYMRQAALGLQHAFEKGMVHRDLKPQNLMLTPKGTVKLLDMGLARVASETPDKAGLTGAGATLGTPEYIAPEQALDAAKADIRSDIYSLGCTLYCLLAGKPPFADGTPMQKILGHLEKEPPPLQGLRPEVSAKLAAVVARMMAKDPAQRYQKPSEVALALAPFCKAGAKGVVAVPVAEPAVPVAARSATPTLPAGSSAVRWDTLTDDSAKGNVLPAKKKVQKARSRSAGLAAKKKWLIGGAAAGVALLTFLVLIGLVGLWASGVFKVKTKDGTIVLENLPPDADVTVDGETVTVTPADGKTFTVRVDASKKQHRVEVKKDGFKVFGDEVEVEAGGRKSVLVRLEREVPPATVKSPSKEVAAEAEDFAKFEKMVAALTPQAQQNAVANRLKDRNPGFDGKVRATVDGGVVTGLRFVTDQVTDISPVRALTGLRTLSCYGSEGKGQLADLSPLKDMNLTSFDCWYTRVSDLSPLKDTKLTSLYCRGTRVSDLSPLKDVKLTSLDCWNTRVSDLSPLKDMKLTDLRCHQTQVSDLSPLKDMKLTHLECRGTRVSDLSPLKELKLTTLYCYDTPVTDAGLMPLQEMPSLRVLEIGGPKMSEAGLAHLKKLIDLEHLAFIDTKLTGAGLVHLKGMTGLQVLNLGNTELTDEGLVHLNGLLGLRELILVKTRVTDSGLEHLAGLKNLARLTLNGTAVTDKGVAKLKVALPKCNITR